MALKDADSCVHDTLRTSEVDHSVEGPQVVGVLTLQDGRDQRRVVRPLEFEHRHVPEYLRARLAACILGAGCAVNVDVHRDADRQERAGATPGGS